MPASDALQQTEGRRRKKREVVVEDVRRQRLEEKGVSEKEKRTDREVKKERKMQQKRIGDKRGRGNVMRRGRC